MFSKSLLVFQQKEATFSNGAKFSNTTSVGKNLNFNQVRGRVTLLLSYLALSLCAPDSGNKEVVEDSEKLSLGVKITQA